MRRRWREVLILVGVMALVGSFFGCRGVIGPGEKGEDGLGAKAKTNTSGTVAFSFSYDGTIGGDNYRYGVEKEADGRIIFTYESMEYPDYGEMKREVEQAVLDRLDAIYRENDVCRWEGYSKYNPNVSDGDGFSLRFAFADGNSMYAHGSNCYPDGYQAFFSAMRSVCDPIASELLEDKRQEMIERGFDGTVDSLMAFFRQNGASGADSYEFILSKEGVRNANYDVRIHSESGEFLPVGDYRVYRAVPDEYIDFDGVQALVDKYSLIEWYNYDKAAEDYNNSEWFQIEFGFTGGSRLSAMGTEPPAHYAEFRHDFLQLMTQGLLKVMELPEE